MRYRLCAALVSVSIPLWAGAARAEERVDPSPPRDTWSHYGGDAGGQRFVARATLAAEDLGGLREAWTFRTGDFSDGRGVVPSTTAFEATPILVDDTLFVCSPFNRIFALDARSGELNWMHDPRIDRTGRYANQLVCRGVAHWVDPRAEPDRPCAQRIFSATNDARLIALDAASGEPCRDFGQSGTIDLNPAAGPQRWRGEYQVTSPPVLIGERVVVGSAISDNVRTDAPSGAVRAFDARSGAPSWAWDLAPPGFERSAHNTSAEGFALGTPNVWAPMSVDAGRDLIFLPTGNAAPDYYRGERATMNHYGSSVVALRGSSGEIVWHFQTVHNDLWDYDVPAQPTLTHVERDGERLPVVVQATKMGLLFVLHRETGQPVFGVQERPVPQGGAPGERLSPTQPFPILPPPLVPHTLSADDAWGLTFWDRGHCRERLASLRNEGIYTPPSIEGSVMYPGNAGGSNWGGVAVHPQRQLLIANTINAAWEVRLVPRAELAAERAAFPGVELSPQEGTPYGMRRRLLMSPLDLPCNPPPWGTLAAVDLSTGSIRWQVPLGTVRDLAPVPLPLAWGVPNLGGPLVTANGLVFIAAAFDDYLRAFDLETGTELWKGRLPAGGQATPMMYELDGRPYIVIAAGGHARGGTRLGDSLVAFSLEGP